MASTASAAPPDYDAVATIVPSQSGGVLSGVFTITNFTVSEANQLVANGVFEGTANGVPVTTPASALVGSGPGVQQLPGETCRILDLTLGPLHLDLLGLVIDLNEVHLTITAERGPGNLLGNLLCAVAGLLDPPGPLARILRLLDRINDLLG
jgi:hypothetical protein